MKKYRSASAYESKNIIYFETYWRTIVGVSVAQEPVFAVAKDDLPGLDRAIRACLDGVREGIPHPTDWKAVQRPIFTITPFKSHRALMAVAKCASIIESDGIVEFAASKNEGARGGFTPTGQTALTRQLDEDLGPTLLQALAQSTYANGKLTKEKEVSKPDKKLKKLE